jgi:hypothetical protein
METSDINETHCSDPVLTYPSIMTTKREAPQVDIDLSISNSNVSDEYARHMSYGKQVEIIDLENDCTLEDKDFDNSQRKYVPLIIILSLSLSLSTLLRFSTCQRIMPNTLHVSDVKKLTSLLYVLDVVFLYMILTCPFSQDGDCIYWDRRFS